MKLTVTVVAGALALACMLAGPAFAQAVVTAAAPVAVVATPATQAAVQEQAWWSGLASEAITALAGLISLAVATLAPFALAYIRSKSRLAGILISQALFDKLVLGIQNQIRAEAEKLKGKLPGGMLPPELSPDAKAAIANAAQPRIEAAFKDTLQHFGKAPGSQAVRDMILGHVETALKASAPVAIPGVMARS
jgi:hypothetical protein